MVAMRAGVLQLSNTTAETREIGTLASEIQWIWCKDCSLLGVGFKCVHFHAL